MKKYFLFLTLVLNSQTLYSEVKDEEKLRKSFASLTATSVKCEEKDVKIVKYSPVRTSTGISFTWTAVCKGKTYNCAPSDQGPNCSNKSY